MTRARPLAFFVLLAATHCTRSPALDATAPTVPTALPSPTAPTSPLDAAPVTLADATAAPYHLDVLTRDGRPVGYIRFVHVAPALGPVHFIATSAPNYEPSRVEAVVAPGSTSDYLVAVNVPHQVRVLPAGVPDDGGSPLAEPILSDVYNNAGCTVVLGGRGTPGRRPSPEARRLVRVVDLPRRGDAGTALVRFMPAIVGAPPFDLREGETVLYNGLSYLEITGLRIVSPGEHTFVLAATDGGPPLGEPVRVVLPSSEAQTLWLWGARARGRVTAGDGGIGALLTNDLPPSRRSAP